MAFFRIRRHRRGFNELEGNTRFMDRVEFMQGSGLLLKRSVNYYVDGKDGDDTNNGLSMDRPKATIAAAITLMNARINWSESPWARGDNLFIAAGLYAENLTSLPYGCNVYGLGDAFDLNGERGVTVKPASGSPVDCGSVINTRVQNVAFESPDTSVIFQADNFNRNVLEGCLLSGLPGASPTTTRGFEVVKDMTGNILRGCIFQLARNGVYIVTDNANSKQASGNIIEDCYVRGADQKGIYFGQHTVPSLTQINHCVIGSGETTLALGLDDDSGMVNVSNTMFTATACDPAHAGGGHYNNCHLNGVLLTNS